MIVTGQIGGETTAIHFVTDAPPQSGIQHLAQQMIQFGQLQRGHGRAQVDHRMRHVGQGALMGRIRPAALLADGPGDIQ